jgi:diguanylate cyclase (GGDEF)-like protein
MQDNRLTYGPRRDYDPEPFRAPRVFLRSLTFIATVSVVILLAFTGFGVWSVVSHYVIRFAENSSVNMSGALALMERNSLFTTTPRGERRLVEEIPPERLERLDERIRQLLKPFGIAKIKVYTRDARIIYSTDHRIIGERDLDNRRLRNALNGINDSELARKDREQDLPDEQRLDIDVVETYVPIYGDDSQVIGCFEVYVDVTPYRVEIRQIVFLAVAVIGVITLAVYGIAFTFLRKSTLKLREAEDNLQRYAVSDPLTGLYNRGHTLMRARQELTRLQREREQNGRHSGMSITMLDLDYFKKVNDDYGHLAGDEVLRETARRILATTRAYDLVGRFGGEEFLVVHPDADYRHAQAVARRIWAMIRAQPYIIEDRRITVTASVGVATLGEAEDDLTPALRRADRALYEAKHTGRDRVV